MLFAPNAFAQTAAGSSNCDKHGPTTAGVRCVLKGLDHRIDAANARAKAADAKAAGAQKDGAAADAQKAVAREQDECGQFLLKGVADGKWTQPEILAQAGGKFTPRNVCEIAKRRGFDKRAALN